MEGWGVRVRTRARARARVRVRVRARVGVTVRFLLLGYLPVVPIKLSGGPQLHAVQCVAYTRKRVSR